MALLAYTFIAVATAHQRHLDGPVVETSAWSPSPSPNCSANSAASSSPPPPHDETPSTA
ncbi:hypothetical protein [Nonomuraea sp. B5E05]|uniref:hypothetical protein n=1 Tax=Nonomuraea sp. B5E05 TaxID=3153569 RepID=UPI0032619ABB